MKKFLNFKVLVPVLTAIIILLIPRPEGLQANAWQFFAIFIGVILALIFEPLPSAAVGFLGVTIAALFGLVHAPDASLTPAQSVSWALSGFGNSTVWLIFAAFMFSLGYKKTGLGKRVALIMIKYIGKNTLGLGYAISFADLILAPFTPSNSARSGGTIYPIVSNIPPIYGSYPDKNPEAIGRYLTWVSFAGVCVTSSMFMTALAPNVLATDILARDFGIQMEWGKWFSTIGLICLPLFLLTPLLTYFIYPPKIKKSPEVSAWASEELKKIGKVSFKECLLLVFVFLALLLWIFGENFGVHSTTAALIIVCLLFIFNILTWDDILENKSAWNVFIWFATLVALASGLSTVGFLNYIANLASSYLGGLSSNTVILVLVILFIVLHYFFASTTSHVTALLPLFMTLGISLVDPSLVYKLGALFAGSLGLMGIITPYATGPAPIWYGSGFISQRTWWILGFIFGLIYFIPYIGFGLLIIK